MMTNEKINLRTKELNELTMRYETAVISLPAENYPEAFYDFYEIKHRKPKPIPSPEGFYETLKEVSGDDCWKPIAEKTEALFGTPKRVTVFEDASSLIRELEGPHGQGLGPFFFIFDLMFCEYEACTLCFISGSNN